MVRYYDAKTFIGINLSVRKRETVMENKFKMDPRPFNKLAMEFQTSFEVLET